MDEIIALYESQLVGLFDEAGHAYSEAARQEVLARIAWRALALTWPRVV
jgi:hypothetical protein